MNHHEHKKENEETKGRQGPSLESIRENVLHAIKDGEVTMRPRWYFVVKAILVGAGALLIFLGTIYLASFVIFVLYKTGIIYVPDFGLHGIMGFLFNLPWLLIFVAFVFAIFLEVLVQRYSFVYKKPLLYSVCGVLVLVVAGSVIVAATPLHSQFFKNSRERQLPFFPGQLYLQFGFEHNKGIHRGVVTSVTDEGFYIKEDSDRMSGDRDPQMLASTSPNSSATNSAMAVTTSSTSTDLIKIIVTPETRFPGGIGINVGDTVVVFGEEADNGMIKAFGVERVTNDLEMNTGMYPGSGTSSFPHPDPNSPVFYIHFSQ